MIITDDPRLAGLARALLVVTLSTCPEPTETDARVAVDALSKAIAVVLLRMGAEAFPVAAAMCIGLSDEMLRVVHTAHVIDGAMAEAGGQALQ